MKLRTKQLAIGLMVTGLLTGIGVRAAFAAVSSSSTILSSATTNVSGRPTHRRRRGAWTQRRLEFQPLAPTLPQRRLQALRPQLAVLGSHGIRAPPQRTPTAHFDQGDRITKLLEMVPTDPVGGVPRTKKQVQKRLTARELEAFSTAYRAGSSIRELAQFFKINRTTVHAHVDTLGLPGAVPDSLSPTWRRRPSSTSRVGR